MVDCDGDGFEDPVCFGGAKNCKAVLNINGQCVTELQDCCTTPPPNVPNVCRTEYVQCMHQPLCESLVSDVVASDDKAVPKCNGDILCEELVDCMLLHRPMPVFVPATCEDEYNDCVKDTACATLVETAVLTNTELNCGSSTVCTTFFSCAISDTTLPANMPEECRVDYVHCNFAPACYDIYQSATVNGTSPDCEESDTPEQCEDLLECFAMNSIVLDPLPDECKMHVVDCYFDEDCLDTMQNKPADEAPDCDDDDDLCNELVDCLLEHSVWAEDGMAEACDEEYAACMFDSDCYELFVVAEQTGSVVDCAGDTACEDLQDCIASNMTLPTGVPAECQDEYGDCMMNPVCEDAWTTANATGEDVDCGVDTDCEDLMTCIYTYGNLPSDIPDACRDDYVDCMTSEDCSDAYATARNESGTIYNCDGDEECEALMTCIIEEGEVLEELEPCKDEYIDCMLDEACVSIFDTADATGMAPNCGSNAGCTALVECANENVVLPQHIPEACKAEYVDCLLNAECEEAMDTTNATFTATEPECNDNTACEALRECIEGEECEVPDDWCQNNPNAVFEMKDCDNDGVPDPVCLGAGGKCRYKSSAASCSMTPSGCCTGVTGEEACEDHGYTVDECAQVGCCKYVGDECMSAVGSRQCIGGGPYPPTPEPTSSDSSDDDLPDWAKVLIPLVTVCVLCVVLALVAVGCWLACNPPDVYTPSEPEGRVSGTVTTFRPMPQRRVSGSSVDYYTRTSASGQVPPVAGSGFRTAGMAPAPRGSSVQVDVSREQVDISRGNVDISREQMDISRTATGTRI